jgi:hypothetical protein
MVRRKPEGNPEPLPPPATTLEGREDQLISAAMDLVERRIHEGTASAQETVHFLRLGSVRNQLEQDKLRHENEVLQTRVKEMESRKSSEELYAKALAAMRGYQGLESMEDDDDPDVY